MALVCSVIFSIAFLLPLLLPLSTLLAGCGDLRIGQRPVVVLDLGSEEVQTMVQDHGFERVGTMQVHLVAPYRAISRYYHCDTKYRREDTWYLVLHTHICAIPHSATYRAIIVRYPTNLQAPKCFVIVSLQASRDMKSIVAGPLSRCRCKRSLRCVFAQAFCGQKSFREITLNYAKLR